MTDIFIEVSQGEREVSADVYSESEPDRLPEALQPFTSVLFAEDFRHLTYVIRKHKYTVWHYLDPDKLEQKWFNFSYLEGTGAA